MSPETRSAGPVVALCGGIGGAKLALGLYRHLGPDRLTVVVNTGDDFEHLGLHISPDLDTVLYTLSGRNNPDSGWGRAGETWNFMAALEELGGETWFQLGDRDLALHVERTRRLRAGEPLSRITASIAERFGLKARILPMSEDPLRTIVHTPGGPLPFQHYFVRERSEPVVTRIEFDGAEDARAQPEALRALSDANLQAVVICPSNPYLSVDPILAVPGLRSGLAACPAPVVAVSPLVGGRAIRGPTAKIMGELGFAATAQSVCAHYQGLLDGFVLDREDAETAGSIGLPTLAAQTVMRTLEDRERLAQAVLEFARDLAAGGKQEWASS
jgi:LPPG:FO 2-phospho-L-lactate transferase